MDEDGLRFEDLPPELDDIGAPHYDRLGQPVGLRRWMVLHSDKDYVRLALDRVGEHEISTVWLGLDHNFGDGPPLIFETMVFPGSSSICVRSATEAEALRVHAETVAAMRTQLDVFGE